MDAEIAIQAILKSTPRAQSHGAIIWNENLEVFACCDLLKQKYNSKSRNATDISYIQIKVLVADIKAQGYCFPCWIWPASWFILALQILIEVNLRQYALPSFYFAGERAWPYELTINCYTIGYLILRCS
ncbi:hypothetical protein Peur_073857 [Populus x canadensis]